MMRVLLVTGSFPPMKCGVGDYTYHLATALSRNDCLDVAVLTDLGALPVSRDSDFVVFPIIKDRMRSIFQTIKKLHRWKPDVIHFQYPTMGYKGWGVLHILLPIVVWLMRIPVYMTWHEPFRITRFRIPNSMIIILFSVILQGLIFVRPNYLDLMPSWFSRIIRNKNYRMIPNASTIPTRRLNDTQVSVVREKLGLVRARLVVFFGFSFPNKNVEQVFEIANANRDFVVLITDLDPSLEYQKKILEIVGSETWKGRVNVTGFLPAENVAEILASADAVILPLEDGAGVWNTSVHAVIDQGTFLVTTSLDERGYSPESNVYYSKPNDIADMRLALNLYLGRKRKNEQNYNLRCWDKIANDHSEMYRSSING